MCIGFGMNVGMNKADVKPKSSYEKNKEFFEGMIITNFFALRFHEVLLGCKLLENILVIKFYIITFCVKTA